MLKSQRVASCDQKEAQGLSQLNKYLGCYDDKEEGTRKLGQYSRLFGLGSDKLATACMTKPRETDPKVA